MPWEQKLASLSSRGRLRSLPKEAINVAAWSQRSHAQNAARSLRILANMTQEDFTLHNSEGRKVRLSSLINKLIKRLIHSRLKSFYFCFNVYFLIQAQQLLIFPPFYSYHSRFCFKSSLGQGVGPCPAWYIFVLRALIFSFFLHCFA